AEQQQPADGWPDAVLLIGKPPGMGDVFDRAVELEAGLEQRVQAPARLPGIFERIGARRFRSDLALEDDVERVERRAPLFLDDGTERDFVGLALGGPLIFEKEAEIRPIF